MRKFYLLMFGVIAVIESFAQNFALTQLENSPRHHEWVKVQCLMSNDQGAANDQGPRSKVGA